MKSVVGIWCGLGTPLLAQVHGVPLLRLTIKRTGPCFCLVPWTTDLDWLEGEIKSWKACQVRRCHPDERIAMRDLVVELNADLAVLVQGDCGSIDRAEIELAEARVRSDWERYPNEHRKGTPRVRCLRRREWLQVADTDEWGPYPVTPLEIQQHLTPQGLDVRWAKRSSAKQVPESK